MCCDTGTKYKNFGLIQFSSENTESQIPFSPWLFVLGVDSASMEQGQYSDNQTDYSERVENRRTTVSPRLGCGDF